VENVETITFLENAAKHLVHLTNSEVETVACDLHPKFITTRLAQSFAEEKGWQTMRVQHHYAHVAALMAEHNVGEILGVCCDGYGYGQDGEAWGGEVLLCNDEEFGFKRVAHLQRQPMTGGDLAAYYPLRMAAGILHGSIDLEPWLLQNKHQFPHGEQEVHLILQQLSKKALVPGTTSCGRVLDAVSAVLDLCYERTYEGEPSMKLESAAMKGKDVLKLKPLIEGDTLNTTQLLLEIFENKDKHSKADLAHSAHAYLAEGLARLAIEKASENGVRTIGFSGGVACNEILTLRMRRIVTASDLQFLVHRDVPPGDGGLSFGQAVASGFFSS
jgi:hydrogenase maturation protein HypF